jgi:hypothetical protein
MSNAKVSGPARLFSYIDEGKEHTWVEVVLGDGELTAIDKDASGAGACKSWRDRSCTRIFFFLAEISTCLLKGAGRLSHCHSRASIFTSAVQL